MFESIRHVNRYGEEFWYARELQIALEYKEWRNFKKVIDKAITTCENSKNIVSDHFVEFNKMVNIGSGAERELEDMELSRYACYLIVQNRSTIQRLGGTMPEDLPTPEKSIQQIAREQKKLK